MQNIGELKNPLSKYMSTNFGIKIEEEVKSFSGHKLAQPSIMLGKGNAIP